MKVSFTLSTFSYSGWSIGRDIRVEVGVENRTSVFEKRMRPLYFTRPDIPLGIIETEERQEIPVTVTVIEKDRVFSDRGEKILTVVIPTAGELPKTYTVSLEVAERRFIFWKTKATFTVGIEARVISSEMPSIRSYDSYNGEDYNRYDDIIREAVVYWNDQFARDVDPPPELLDPNLVKAMAYQESHVGNDPKNNGLVNIMQVGKTGDPSLLVLQGLAESNEYWVHDGQKMLLRYPSAKVESVRDSVFWGVRWLYHKAHKNTQKDDGSWGNEWRTWKEAVHRYGPGKTEYAENVWSVYQKGISERDKGIKLWSFVPWLLFIFLPFFGMGISNADIRRAFDVEFPSYSKVLFRTGVDVVRYEKDPSLFVAIAQDTDDWFEGLEAGKIVRGKIVWLPMTEDSIAHGILSARFINLVGFDRPILEVWSQTHQWNGGINLYLVYDNRLEPLADVYALDEHFEDVWNPDGYPQYGGGFYSCSGIYKNRKLNAEYYDTNGDGVDELVLSGVRQIYCGDGDKNGYENTLVDEQEVKEVYTLPALGKGAYHS